MGDKEPAIEGLLDNFTRATTEAKDGVDLDRGLSDEQYQQRFAQHGPNESPQRHRSLWVMFFSHFWGWCPWMLEAVIAIAGSLGEVGTAVLVSILLLVNAIIAFSQDLRGMRAVEALKEKLQVLARVVRNGQWSQRPVRELVPGDVVRLRIGDFVPADIAVFHGSCDVDQSALTGESEALQAEEGKQVFSGSVVVRGEVTGIVVRTGIHTFFGKTIELVETSTPAAHTAAVLNKLARTLVCMVFILLVICVVILAAQGRWNRLRSMVTLLLMLLVSAVPVALLPMFTVSMAVGSLELSKHGVLVSRLNATEDAAGMSYICVDKTGTITLNKLEVVDVAGFGGFEQRDVLRVAALCSSDANQDPIDCAILAARAKAGHQLSDAKCFPESQSQPDSSVEVLHFIPFDPKTRRTEAIVRLKENLAGVGQAQELVKLAKGAVATLCHLAKPSDQEMQAIQKLVEGQAKKGYRSIAVAIGRSLSPAEIDRMDYTIIGLVGLRDPPRPESAEVLRKLKGLGIKVKMLTGDSVLVASEIAKEVGMTGGVVTLEDLRVAKDDAQVLAELDKRTDIEQTDVFAQAFPAGKHSMVRILQHRHCTVGMTGDGVNDAPALKQAEVGIATSNATDVAKGAASVILTMEGLAGILELVRIGRQIHRRLETWTLLKIVKTFQQAVFIIIALLVLDTLVLSSFDMVLLLLLIDFVTISLATDNVRPGQLPQRWEISRLVQIGVSAGLLCVGSSLGMLFAALRTMNYSTGDPKLHTLTFTIMFCFGITLPFSMRELGFFFRSRPSVHLLSILFLEAAGVITLVSLGIPPYVPRIGIVDALTVWAWVVGSVLLVDGLKSLLHWLWTKRPVVVSVP